MKKPSLKEKVEVYENFLYRLHFHRSLTLSEDKVAAMLKMSDAWVEAHSGDRPPKEIDEAINLAFERLKTLP